MKKILVTVFVMLLAAGAAAEDKINLEVGLGAFFPTGSANTNIGKLDYNSAYMSYAMTGRYYFNNYIGVSASLSGYESEVDPIMYNGIQYKGELSATMLGIGLTLRKPWEKVSLYGTAGAAFIFTDLEMDRRWGPDIEYNLDPAVGFYGDAGVRYYIAPNLYIGTSVRYTYGEKNQKGADLDLSGVTATINAGVAF